VSGPDRRGILGAALRVLDVEGTRGLTMRRLAEAAGTSTMVLYSRFGSREGVIDALLTIGFSDFADRLTAVQSSDPVAHLMQLGREYRRFGLSHPLHFRLMWSGPSIGEPACPDHSASAIHGRRAFNALVLGVTRLLAADDRPARDAEPLAIAIWSVVHGFVSLELAGTIPSEADPDALYERTLRFAVEGLLARPLSSPSSAPE